MGGLKCLRKPRARLSVSEVHIIFFLVLSHSSCAPFKTLICIPSTGGARVDCVTV